MEKQILEILKSIQVGQENIIERLDGLENKIGTVESKIDTLENKFEVMEKKLDSVVEQAASLTEFKTNIETRIFKLEKDLSDVEILTAKNYKDIALLKAMR